MKIFKASKPLAFNYSQPPSTLSPHFKNELFSNDYIISLCRQKLYREALQAFDFLDKNTNFKVFPNTYASLVSACSCLRSIEHGRRIHDHLLGSKCEQDIVLQNHILNMYGKCGSFWDARKVFDKMRERNVVSWTSLIAGYSQNRKEDKAVELYLQMLRSGCRPDQFTFGSVVKACSGLGNALLGRQLHAHVVKSETGSHSIAQNALTSMYTKFGSIEDAFDVFKRVERKDLISWGSIIAGFSQLGYDEEALAHFKEMLLQGAYTPNEFIFGSAFSACTGLVQPEYGRQIHGICIKFGLGRDNFAGCSLCDMYAKCGHLEAARIVFCHIDRPDLVSWNAMITGFSSVGDADGAISFFSRMQHNFLIPDEVSVLSALSACMSFPALSQGRQVHSYIIKTALDFTVSVCNALLTMYAKCSNLDDAFVVFKDMRNHADSVSWNAILTACTQHNQAGEVFRLLKLMLVSEIRPDFITLSNVIGVCADVESLEVGNQIHCFIVKSGLVLGVTVSNGLIDMYTKCGSLESAQKLFSLIEIPDVVSWSTLILGYAQSGCGEEALELFKAMNAVGVKPNEVTMVGVLTACSHIGLVEEGRKLYKIMESEHGIVPTREHCSCMVDLLARAGCLHEAVDFIKQMTVEPDIVVWKTLLASCRTRGNTEIGKQAAEKVLELDPSNPAALVLLCNINASSGRWDEVARLRNLMRESGVKKVPGQSWIEIKDRIHVFLVEDSSHPERGQIYGMLEELWLQMLDDGCVPLQP
ncbi:pentatricopeptide repeat-containing protein At3g53360, mitochondrial [Argentina anserina]|uniref:pentatricopeptide repeat-containing protein At3g53360, mitochondrial n=1 Tax=Argentina anserina TaxID=57926 RepID=UPI002176648C|nr:pentatricopeptide repeat-containing protein At3g53360, mitochondrial [Potentilla anserina]